MQPEDDKQIYSFPKQERISSCLAIEQLVRSRNIVNRYPVKCYYVVAPVTEEISMSRVAVSVPKRLFKRAVDRNYIKRLIRESYRLNKVRCLEPLSVSERYADMLFLYMGKDKPSFQQIQRIIIEILEHIAKQA